VLATKASQPSVSTELRHQVHHYLELAEFIGAPALPPADWVAQRGPLPGAGKTRPWRVAVCPGAEFGAAKRWFPDRFAQVIREVSAAKQETAGERVEWVLVGVAKDAPAGDAIEAACEGCALNNLIGRTGLRELMETLKECDVLLSNDTGTMHLGALLGVPLVAVFGSTEPLLTGPLGVGNRVIQHRVPCGPCFRRECHLDFACMRGVEASEVTKAVLSLLDQSEI
jgi:lipopolysaccharide heptosyltransferase II